MDAIALALPPWAQLALAVLFVASEVLGQSSRVAPNSIVGLVLATVRGVAAKVKIDPPAPPPPVSPAP